MARRWRNPRSPVWATGGGLRRGGAEAGGADCGESGRLRSSRAPVVVDENSLPTGINRRRVVTELCGTSPSTSHSFWPNGELVLLTAVPASILCSDNGRPRPCVSDRRHRGEGALTMIPKQVSGMVESRVRRWLRFVLQRWEQVQCDWPSLRCGTERQMGVAHDSPAHHSVAAAPITAPIPTGSIFPNISASSPERVPLDEIAHQSRIELGRQLSGQFAGALRQPCAALYASGPRRSRRRVCSLRRRVPPAPARRRSRSSSGMPYTSATASTKTDVASRNTTVSPATADRGASVPIPGQGGSGSHCRSAGHDGRQVAVSNLFTISAGRRPVRRRSLATGPMMPACARVLRSITCDNMRADIDGSSIRPATVATMMPCAGVSCVPPWGVPCP